MSEAAVMRAEARDSERKFYSRMALALVVVVLIGFGPSFYLRGIVPPYPRPNPTLPPSVLLHGGLLTLWILAFVAQTQLVAARKTHLHMKLGAATLVLALLIIPMMYLIAVWQVGRANQPPFTTPLEWTIVPLAVIPVYTILLWNGWRRRREAQWHKRLMLCATIVVVLGPSFGRMPIAPPTLIGFTIQHAVGLILFVPLMLWDRRTVGHIHPATRLGFSLAVLMIAVPTAFLATGAWGPIASHLPGVG
jgi:hypothetical protein